jgi:hypothetical protein
VKQGGQDEQTRIIQCGHSNRRLNRLADQPLGTADLDAGDGMVVAEAQTSDATECRGVDWQSEGERHTRVANGSRKSEKHNELI